MTTGEPGPAADGQTTSPKGEPAGCPGRPKGELVLVLLLTALAAAARFHDLGLDPPWTIYTDPTDEGWWAGNAAHQRLFGSWLIAGNYNTVFVSPVATLAFWLAFGLKGVSLASARLVPALAGAACVPLLYWAVRPFASRTACLAASTLVGLSFVAIGFSRMTLLDFPAAAFCLVAVGWYLRTGRGAPGDARRLAGMSLALLVALLTKSSSIVLVGVLAVHGLLKHAASRRAGEEPVPRAGVLQLWAALAVPVAGWALVQVVCGRLYPEEFRIALGVNVADKVASLGAIGSSWLWFLAFNQLLENSPIVVIAAWTGATMFLYRLACHGRETMDEPAAEGLACLWFLAAALFVASFAYQPKRYHMLMFVPACLVAASLAVRLARGAFSRAELVCGAAGSGLVLAFAFAMTWIRRCGQFVPQTRLDPANVSQLFWLASLLFGAYAAVVALAAWRSRSWTSRSRWPMVVLVSCLGLQQLVLDGRAYCRWVGGARSTMVPAAREIGERMRAGRRPSDPEPVLGGGCAHTVMLEGHVPGRRIIVEPQVGHVVIPADVTHVLTDDARELAVYRSYMPGLDRAVEIGSWTICPDWEIPVHWRLYELRAGSDRRGTCR